jgi:predicted MFS family arabinose efflux permease
MAGSMMMLTYLAPYLTETTEGSIDQRAVAFGLAGVAGVIGILAGGFATDRWGAARTLAAGVGAIVVSMDALWALWAVRPAPPVAVLSVLAVWGGAAFWNSPAVQARLAGLAGPVATQALALNTSGTYLGVSLGGAGGGLALGLGGPGALPPVAAGCGLLALAVLAAASSATAPGDVQCRDR